MKCIRHWTLYNLVRYLHVVCVKGHVAGMRSSRTVLHLEDGSRTKRLWPWPQRGLALALTSKTTGHGLGLKEVWPCKALTSKTTGHGLGLKEVWPWP